MASARLKVAVIGAGVGGLAAAIDCARAGFEVTILEAAEMPGGKLRAPSIAGAPIDSGPTVLTMRWVFEDLFRDAGSDFAEQVRLYPAELLCRHGWGDGSRLDLFRDLDRSVEAINRFAGKREGDGYRAFARRSAEIYDTLKDSYIAAERPTPVGLVRASGLQGLPGLVRISPFATLWNALAGHFRDPRLRQLFGRYATYCGSSPFAAPATLMLVAHVERAGVWLIEGGMHRLAMALGALAARLGASLRCRAPVAEITLRAGRAAGVTLASGEHLQVDAVICNADVGALAVGRFGAATRRAAPAVARAARSLSAITWAMRAETTGFPLAHHSVFFSDDYAAEFEDIFERRRIPAAPTTYVCAQDRDDLGQRQAADPERLLVLINAPPDGDIRPLSDPEIERCMEASFRLLGRCGLRIMPQAIDTTDPSRFEAMFPATGGALYGRANHGWAASFARPGSASRIQGLYLAGGSVHPGPGVPMATLSGRLAAARLITDLASTRPSRMAVTNGGTSTG